MSKNATHYFVDSKVSPNLQPCRACGSKAAAFLDTDNLGSTPNQPFVYIQCRDCQLSISSREVFGDLSNASLLDKLSRVSRLWNHPDHLQPLKPLRKEHLILQASP